MLNLLFGFVINLGWVILSERSKLIHLFSIPHILALSIFMQIAEVLESTGFNGFYKINNVSERYLICEVCFNGCEDAVYKANQVGLHHGFTSVPVEIILCCLVRVGHLTCRSDKVPYLSASEKAVSVIVYESVPLDAVVGLVLRFLVGFLLMPVHGCACLRKEVGQ